MRSNPTILWASALALGLVVTGCSKQKAAAINPAVEPANQAATPPASPPVAAVPAASPGGVAAENETPQTRDLQASVDAYVIIYKHKPASLDQLVREGFLAALPAAPPGKRYAYDSSAARVSVVPR